MQENYSASVEKVSHKSSSVGAYTEPTTKKYTVSVEGAINPVVPLILCSISCLPPEIFL